MYLSKNKLKHKKGTEKNLTVPPGMYTRKLTLLFTFIISIFDKCYGKGEKVYCPMLLTDRKHELLLTE